MGITERLTRTRRTRSNQSQPQPGDPQVNQGETEMIYTAKPNAGSTVHTENVPNFDTLQDAIDYYVARGWRLSVHDTQHAKMELWLDHSNDPMLQLYGDLPDHIVFLGPATYDFLNPFA
jgi:hypothetical protein